MTLHVQMDLPAEPAVLEAALEGLVQANMAIMRARGVGGDGFPQLYATRVRYRRELPGREDWKTADRVLDDGEGDCEDLTGYRTAELRLAGELGAFGRVVPTPNGKYHAIVQRESGVMEDPSKVLIRKEKIMAPKAKFVVRELPQGQCLGAVSIPLRDGSWAHSTEVGFDAWSALSTAMQAVLAAAPVIAAIYPPAGMALMAAAKIIDMNPGGLKDLIQGSRASEPEKKLAAKVLAAKQAGAGAGAEVGWSLTDLAKVALAPLTMLMPSGGGRPAAGPGRTVGPMPPPAAPPFTPAPPSTTPPGYYPPGTAPGYPPPPGYYPPPPGYPPGTLGPPMSTMPPGYGYPPPGYGYPPPGYGYPPPGYGYPPQGDPYAGQMVPPGWFDQSVFQQPQAQPLTPEEAAAIMLWGSGSFAEGSFPGYSPQPAY